MNRQGTQQPQQQGEQTNWIGGAFNSMILSVESWLHTDFGERYLGAKGVLAVIIMFSFRLLYPLEDTGPMDMFIAGFILFRVAGRIERWVRQWKKRPAQHGNYTGRPILLGILPWLGERNVKRLEPVLVILLGCLLHNLNPPLGVYLSLSGLFLLVRNLAMHDAERQRALEMHDAFIEQELIEAEFRKVHQ